MSGAGIPATSSTVGIRSARLAPSTWASPLNLAAGGMIIFVAYEGFELIANAGADVRNPETTMPRAFYASVVIVIVLYLLIAAVTVGNLALDKIAAAQDYALAAAAKPMLGQAGFTLIAVAALLSTTSAINATLYGSARLSFIIAKDGELPEALERAIWHKPLEGLFITSALTLVIANTLDLSSISTIGSAGFLIIFAAVNLANVRLNRQTHARPWISLIGTAVCVLALAALIWRTAARTPDKLWVLAGLLLLAFLIEAGYRLIRKREIQVSAHSSH